MIGGPEELRTFETKLHNSEYTVTFSPNGAIAIDNEKHYDENRSVFLTADEFDQIWKVVVTRNIMKLQPIDRFMQVFNDELWISVSTDPVQYGLSEGASFDQIRDHSTFIADRMETAIKYGHFNKDTPTFKRTCKKLGIKHTYKAIREFINGGE